MSCSLVYRALHCCIVLFSVWEFRLAVYRNFTCACQTMCETLPHDVTCLNCMLAKCELDFSLPRPFVLQTYWVPRLSYRLRCFIYRLISPMHRTAVCIDASNFQPMNGIKQHLRESIIRRDICFNMSGVSCWQFSWLNLISNNVILSLSIDRPMYLTTVWCKSDASVKSTGE